MPVDAGDVIFQEGERFTWKASAPWLEPGTTLYWAIRGKPGGSSNNMASDFVTDWTGTGVLDKNHEFSITSEIKFDNKTEGDEKFGIDIFSSPFTGLEASYQQSPIISSAEITVKDDQEGRTGREPIISWTSIKNPTIPSDASISKYYAMPKRGSEFGTDIKYTENQLEYQIAMWFGRVGNLEKGDVLYWEFLPITASAGDDYSHYRSSGSVVLSSGQKFDGVAFYILADDLIEGDEKFKFRVYNDSDKTIIGYEEIITIIDYKQPVHSATPSDSSSKKDGDTATITINDTSLTPAESTFSIDSTNAWEGDTAQVLITRTGNTSAAIDLTVNTVNGTAKSGSDYTQIKDKTIRFGAGVKSKKLSIATKEDSAVESDETFKVKISSTDDLAQFKTQAATVTIEDNDQAVINNTTNVTNITNNTTTNVINATNNYAINLVGDVLIGSPQINQNSYDTKFYNLGGGRYGIKRKGNKTIEEITATTSLGFKDKVIFPDDDVAAVFNQVKGIDDVSGVVFRLYNAAFARLPDAKGLENWITGNSTGGMTYATSADEFSSSQEFQNRYGANTTDTQYITTLYDNVLGRSPDAEGLANYQNLLANGKERGALLLDFSESPENRGLFTEVTGLS